jgi:hypothetical protein
MGVGMKTLKSIEFRYRDEKYGDTERLTMGFDALEVSKVFSEDSYSIVRRDEDGYMSIDYVQLIAPMWKVIMEQEQRIIELERKR